MTSIHTNNSAMVALESLRSINNNLAKIQTQVSTGYKVSSSADNAAIFSVATSMRSDVAGFETISESLSLGKANVAVARSASEQVGELLSEIKDKVISAKTDGVDREAIQADIDQLEAQINSIVDSASFNGVNLIDGSTTTTSVVSSLSTQNGVTTTGNISVSGADLSTTAGITLTTAAASIDVTTIDENGVATNHFEFTATTFLDTSGGNGSATAVTADDTGVDPTLNTGMLAGDVIELTMTRIDDSGTTDVSLGAFTARYTVREGDTVAAVASGVKNAILDSGLTTDEVSFAITAGVLEVTNQTNDNFGIAMTVSRGTGTTAIASSIAINDATTDAQLDTMISQLDTAIDDVTTVASTFGSAESRIDIQSEFVTSLVDSLNAGISALVDTDLEEAAAKLQALQVQQQLGLQALSIANSSPSSVLALFG